MTLIVTTASTPQRIAPPALPQAAVEYSRLHQHQLNNVLRLYLNCLNILLSEFESTSTILPALTVYTVATLPSAATSGAGARSFVSDASAPTFGSTVAGGGAVKIPVYSDGTNWKVG